MKTTCVRRGQIEVGIIEHQGQEFSALGATVAGCHVTGYTRLVNREIHLSTWCGQTMLSCRSEIIRQFWCGSLALMFRLARGRFVVGYALGENGMLFRGELLTNSDEDDARRHALMVCECFADLDAEDDETVASESWNETE